MLLLNSFLSTKSMVCLVTKKLLRQMPPDHTTWHVLPLDSTISRQDMPRAECFWNQDTRRQEHQLPWDISSQGQALNHPNWFNLIPTNKGVQQYSSPQNENSKPGKLVTWIRFNLLVVMGAVSRRGFAFWYSETFCVALAEGHWDSWLIVFDCVDVVFLLNRPGSLISIYNIDIYSNIAYNWICSPWWSAMVVDYIRKLPP